MRKLIIFIPAVFLVLLIISGCQTLGGGKRSIRLQNPTPVDDYQVMILLGRHNFNYRAAKPDGLDVRAFDIQGNILPHWIENWNPHGISALWVRVPDAGTERIVIKSGNPGDTPGSNGMKVFDPVTWEELKTGWLYSGIMPGMVSGWEDPLTEFDYDVKTWKPVDIDTDFVGECGHSRWFVRKEVFIAGGEVTFSGQANDDVVWSLIGSDELYTKIGGDEQDSDGENPGEFTGKIVVEQPFGHYIWAGRGQEGVEGALLRIGSVDSGIGLLYTRKVVGVGEKKPVEEVLEEEIEGEDEAVEEEPGEEVDEDTEEEVTVE